MKEKIEELNKEIEKLKELYKCKKEDLEWANDDFEEELINKELANIKLKIKEYKKRLEELSS